MEQSAHRLFSSNPSALPYIGFKNSSISMPESENLYLQACKQVETWFLMSSPWPVIAIVAAYLVFVLKLGPQYMKDKQPLNIKPAILAYNLFQTCFNFFMVSKMFTVRGAVSYLWHYGCHPMDPAVNPYYIHLNEAAWYFFFSKVLDLLDTVFFILRKKNSHVTFLHVYHHANMVMVTWAYLKFIKGEQGVIVGWINALVHTIMYSYYFLSALGPEVQKYLWWKKYITKMQMAQFVVIIVYMLSLLMAKCELPKSFSFFLIFQGLTFLILFANFYIKSYIVKPKTSAAKASSDHTDAKPVLNGVTPANTAITANGKKANGAVPPPADNNNAGENRLKKTD